MASVHFPCGISPQNLTVVNVQSSSPSTVLHTVGVYCGYAEGRVYMMSAMCISPIYIYIVAH